MKPDNFYKDTDDTLAKALAARLNHDYVSPLTAISNALEIIKLDETQTEMSMRLIEESVSTALRELQFNRIAFGSYGADERITVNELRRRLNDYFYSSNCQLDISQITEAPLKSDAKLWFLTILCLRSSLLTLEGLSITHNDDGWKLSCKGTGMKDRNGEIRAEQHWLRVADTTPNTIHFPLLFAHANRVNYEAIIKRDDDVGMAVSFWRKS